MRPCVAVFSFLILLPSTLLWAAPVPAPSAILDIGEPRRGNSVDKHWKQEAECLASLENVFVISTLQDPKVRELSSVARFKDASPWMAKNIRVTQEENGRRLRVTFREGNREEQVVILNALVQAYVHWRKDRQRFLEEYLRQKEDVKSRLSSTFALLQRLMPPVSAL